MIKFALWRCSLSCSFMISWCPSKLGLLQTGAISFSPILQLPPSLSPLPALAPLQPWQELETGLDAGGSTLGFAGKLSAGAARSFPSLHCSAVLPRGAAPHSRAGRNGWEWEEVWDRLPQGAENNSQPSKAFQGAKTGLRKKKCVCQL